MWSKFKNGDRQAFSSMYQAYFSTLYNYGNKISVNKDLVKDCIQDLFIDLWRNKEHLGETDAIKPYLYKSLRRRLVSELTRKNQQLRTDELSESYDFEFTASHEAHLIINQTTEEQKEALLKAINTLTKRQKEAVFLRYYENMTCQQVASVMGLRLNSTYVLLSQAIDLLKNCLTRIMPPLFFCFLFFARLG